MEHDIMEHQQLEFRRLSKIKEVDPRSQEYKALHKRTHNYEKKMNKHQGIIQLHEGSCF